MRRCQKVSILVVFCRFGYNRSFGELLEAFGKLLEAYCYQNDNNGLEQQQGLQQEGLREYVSDVYSGSMERTYAPGQGNVVF